MRSQRVGAAAPADQLALELPGLPPFRLIEPVLSPPRRRAAVAAPPPSITGVVGQRVWLLWEDDGVLGVYADPDTAAADCRALRRHAHGSRLTVHYEWMAVPVFTGRRHDPAGG